MGGVQGFVSNAWNAAGNAIHAGENDVNHWLNGDGSNNFFTGSTSNTLPSLLRGVLAHGAGYSTDGGFHAGMAAPAPAPVSNQTLNNTINHAVATYHTNNPTPPITYPSQPIPNPQANNPGYHIIGDVNSSNYRPPTTYAPGASSPTSMPNYAPAAPTSAPRPAPLAPTSTAPSVPVPTSGSTGQPSGGSNQLDTSASTLLQQMAADLATQQKQRDDLIAQMKGQSTPDYSSPAFQAQLNQARDNNALAAAQGQQMLREQLAQEGLGGGLMSGAQSALQQGQNTALGQALNQTYENERQRAQQVQGQLAALVGGVNPAAGMGQAAGISAAQQAYADQGLGSTLGAILGLTGQLGGAALMNPAIIGSLGMFGL